MPKAKQTNKRKTKERRGKLWTCFTEESWHLSSTLSWRIRKDKNMKHVSFRNVFYVHLYFVSAMCFRFIFVILKGLFKTFLLHMWFLRSICGVLIKYEKLQKLRLKILLWGVCLLLWFYISLLLGLMIIQTYSF